MNASTILYEVPVEVLTHIFSYCIPDPVEDNTGARTTLEILEDVCVTWKAITTSNPLLWTTISIKFHAGTTKLDLERAFTSTKLFLQRSGTLPLCITFIDRYRSPGLDCTPLITLIAQHSKRWQYVHFDMPRKSHRIMNQSSIRNRLSSLEDLRLSVSGSSGSHCLSSSYKIAPQLTAVHLGSGRFPWDDSALPWGQLMSWTGNLHAGDLLHLLHASTRLRSCSVPSVTTYFGDSSLPMVENGALSQLTFELNVDSAWVLPCASLPALTDLTIKDGTRGNSIPALSSRLHGFFSRVHSLQRLQLRQWSSTRSIDLIGLVMLTPEVVSLDVEVTRGLTDDFLMALTPVIPGQADVLPRLEHFNCSGMIFFSESFLHRFIVYRWGGSSEESKDSLPLKSVGIKHYGLGAMQCVIIDRSYDRQGLMRGLRRKGFDISIQNGLF